MIMIPMMENNNSIQPQIIDVRNDDNDSESLLIDFEVVEFDLDELELFEFLFNLDCLCLDLFR